MTICMMCYFQSGHPVFEVFAVDDTGELMEEYDFLFLSEDEALDMFLEVVGELCR